MPNGEFAARRLVRQRKHQRLLKKTLKRRIFKLKQKYDIMGTVPMAKGIVLQKISAEQKQPHSGIIKGVKIQLVKNHKVCSAYTPGDGAINFIDEHDEVTIVGMGGSQRGQMGCIPGWKYKVVAVNGTNLVRIIKGKAEKQKR
jgi:small subunit ribosomal protein S12